MRLLLPLLVVTGLLVAGQHFPDAWRPTTLRAMAALGPVAGWRCSQAALYVYDPRRERADSALIVDLPEALAPADVQVVRVEVNLRNGDAALWVTTLRADPDAKPNRVLVASPGALRAVDIGGTTLCYSALGQWFIVGDHALE